jgi:hypothetical protein
MRGAVTVVLGLGCELLDSTSRDEPSPTTARLPALTSTGETTPGKGAPVRHTGPALAAAVALAALSLVAVGACGGNGGDQGGGKTPPPAAADVEAPPGLWTRAASQRDLPKF